MAKAVNPLHRELDKFKGEAETHRKRADELAGQIRRSTLESELTKAATGLKVGGEAVQDILRYQDLFEVGDDGKVGLPSAPTHVGPFASARPTP